PSPAGAGDGALPHRDLVQPDAKGGGTLARRGEDGARADRRRQLGGVGGRVGDGRLAGDRARVSAVAQSNEPVWCALFGAGGMLSGFLTPVTLLITGIAVPMGWVSSDQLYALAHHPLVRLYLFVLIALPLFHGAHRTLFTLIDVGLKGMRPLLSV